MPDISLKNLLVLLSENTVKMQIRDLDLGKSPWSSVNRRAAAGDVMITWSGITKPMPCHYYEVRPIEHSY